LTQVEANLSHELHVISGIKHRNLLPLRGYCVEFDKDGQVSEQLLVSDFMENGNLADCLFNLIDQHGCHGPSVTR
jgi:hypothetical protein